MKSTDVSVAVMLVGGLLLVGWFGPPVQPEVLCAADSSAQGGPSGGLVVLYDFQSSNGAVVKDRSGVSPPMDLIITQTQTVRRSEGKLEVHGKTLIRSDAAASKLTEAVRKTGEITIEAWVRPAKTNLSGPARLITLSKDPTHRNVTLGQDKDRFDVRLRTTKTSGNGLPSLSSSRKSLQTKLTHVAYTRDRQGTARLFLNGKQNQQRKVAGKTSNWDRSFRLALANELSGDRPWQGTYYLVAIYNRVLSSSEIREHFQAGAEQGGPLLLAQPRLSNAETAKLFASEIAPMLTRRCLECHDSKSREGDLDLSQRGAALAGGISGRAIVPGDAAASRLYQSVQSHEMPKNRPALTAREKKLLRQWIDNGAIWPVDRIGLRAKGPQGLARTNWSRRLTVSEYIETVRSSVGVDIQQQAKRILPPDLRADGFSNTAYNLTVDLGHVGAYAQLAAIIVRKMDIQDFAAQFSKREELTDDCLQEVISGVGYRLFRGPLTEQEIQTYLQISRAVAKEGGDFQEAVGYILEAMLQSPRFLYLMEKQPTAGTSQPLSRYELASRLSYILWGGPPDEQLLQAAQTGELSGNPAVRAQIRRMLQDRRAVTRSRQFVSEWLHLDRLQNLRPNRKHFPKWNPELAEDMRQETLAFFEDVVWKQNRPLSDLLDAQVTWLTPRLAKHYGLKPQDSSSAGNSLRRYDLSSVPSRGGLLTHGSVLTIGGDEASMVARGLFILHDLLDGSVSDPPPCVDTTPVPSKPGLSQRGIAEARISNASCGGCHAKFEPLAFGLERFNGLGAYHQKDRYGNTLRDDGQIRFPGTKTAVAYQSSAEMMQLLAKNQRVQMTITRKVTQFALGRPLIQDDEPILQQIHQSAQQGGGTYASVITAIVMSDLVQNRSPEKRY